MDFKKFNEIAELVGIVAIVASLIFVGMQLRQSKLIALAEVEGTITSASIEMTDLMSENLGVWAKGIADEQLDASEEEVFVGIVAALSDRANSLQRQLRLLGDDETADSVVHEFAAFLHQRPGARRAWIEREADLKKYRSLLHPAALKVTSPYVEMIMADFVVLDQKEG
jgi:hypothetical protein